MPNIQVRLRRGTEAEHDTTNGGFIGVEGEVTVDTTNDTLRVHDGSTAGGVRLAKLSEAGGSGTVTSVGSGTGLTGGPITTSGTLSLASIADLRALGNVSGASAAPTAIEIKDEDTMSSDSATALATQQSIKAYVDSQVTSVQAKCSFDSAGNLDSSGNVNVTSVVRNSTGQYTVTFTSSVTNPIVQATIADDTDIHSSGSVRESKVVVSNLTSGGCVIKTGRGSYSAVDCPVHLIVF